MQRPKAKNLKFPILVGPTGVGKSEIAGKLALKLGMEILSADAFQVFKGLEVGTAQPDKALQERVRHHLVGVLRPGEVWNAVEFAKRASSILWKGHEEGKRFLVVGGAGFYLKALVEGPPDGPGPSAEVRETLREMGRKEILDQLRAKDPKAASKLEDSDLKRLRRALEKTLNSRGESADYKPLGLPNVTFIGLERSREKLDERLLERTGLLWREGLLKEVHVLETSGLPSDHPLWGAIGYQEASAFLKGDMTEAEALERIFRRTRQYAKRQWTWFRHQHEVEWFDMDKYEDTDQVVEKLAQRIEEK